jgi:tetratricopeptide (TPR) repeat protein
MTQGDKMADDEPATVRNEISGRVDGPSVQAGSVQTINVFRPAPHPLPPPRQLPPAPVLFTGRDRELARLDELLDPDAAPVAVLTGTGGVGKTALAMHWAHRVAEQFPDGQLVANLGGYGASGPVDPGEVLGMFLRALGVAPKRVPSSLAEQLVMYQSLTARRSILIVLDDAFSSAQVRVLLPASPSSRVIVTSRSRLGGLIVDGVLLIDLPPLDQTASVGLLTQVIGEARVGSDHRSAQALARVCGGLPIALRVVAGRLLTRPTLSLARVADELRDEATRLSRLSIPDGASVAAVFDASYRSLDPPSALLYRRLALHPGPEFGPGPAAALAAARAAGPSASGGQAGDALPPVADMLDALLAASLLTEVGEDRFRLHDLVRLNAKDRVEADETAPDRAAARLAMLEWYWAAAAAADRIVTPYRRRLPYHPVSALTLLPALADRAQALAWFERERVNLEAAGRCAMEWGHHELSWQLSDVLWPLILVAKVPDRVGVDRRGLAAARAWGNRWAEADMSKRLGRSCTKAGRFDAAEAHLRAAVELYRQLDDPRGVVDAEEGLATLYRDSGRHQLAVDMFRSTLAANRKLADNRATGLSLIALGRLLTALDQSAEALTLLAEARELFGQLAEMDPYNAARVAGALAAAHLRVGDLARAGAEATRAAHRLGQLGSAFERAEALELLGRVALAQADRVGASRLFGAALALLDPLDPLRADEVRHQLATVDSV